MVSFSIKNTNKLKLIPGSIPICVQMVLFSDEWSHFRQPSWTTRWSLLKLNSVVSKTASLGNFTNSAFVS